LGELLRDPTYARRLGEAGRGRSENEFSHETLVRRIESVYCATLDRASVPDVAAKEPDLRTAP
jgi:hypothetical protein